MIKNILILACCFFCLSATTFGQSSQISNAQKELKNINKKIKKNNAELTKKKKEKRIAERSLSKLSKELRYTEYQLKRARNRLKEAKKKSVGASSKLAKIEKKYNETSRQFRKRIVEIYKSKNLGFIDYVFAPKDFLAAVDTTYFFERIIESDTKLIADMKKQHDRYEREKRRVENQSQRIARLQREIQQKERRISKKREQKRKFVSSLRYQIRDIEKRNRELEESSTEMTAFIIKRGRGKGRYYGTGRFIKPVSGWLSSKFGSRKHPIFKRRIKHNGIDLAAPKGYKIKASDSGVIIVAGEKKKYRGYGKVTVIDHGKRTKDGKRISSVYAHQSRILVKEGDIVKKGDLIGWVGSTGYSTGPHLHFEIRENGVPVNPLRYLKL